MLDFHWMVKGNFSRKELINTLETVSPCGYKSVLLPFQLEKNEPLISASMLAERYDNISFMVAIRPYTITPFHLSMFARTFYEFYGNRLIINFVAGSYDEEEFWFTGVKGTIETRRKSLYNMIKEIRGHLSPNEMPTVAVSGSHPDTVKTLDEFGDISVNLKTDFLKNQEALIKTKKRIMIRESLILSDDKMDQAVLFDREKNNNLCGSEDEVLFQIKELEQQGVTDLLVSNTYARKNNEDVHHFVSNYYSMI